MRAAALFLLAPAAAACSPEPATKTVLKQEAESQAEAARLTGWRRLMDSPATTIPAVNQYGFRASAYGGAGGVYGSTGSPITVSNSSAKQPNQATFVAGGQAPDKFDRLTFILSITAPADAATAKDRFARIIQSFLYSARAEGTETLTRVIAAERPARGTFPGVEYITGLSPIAGTRDGRMLTLTFARPGSTAPPMNEPSIHQTS